TSSAVLDFRGTGCPAAGGVNVGTGSPCSGSTRNNTQCVNCSAQNNYLSGPGNQYLTDSNSVSPTQSNNYCSGSSFSGCNTTGSTQAPTATFSLGSLSGSLVPITNEAFTAQYGAVKWLASTSSTPPGSGDGRWNHLPPISLAATHGNTVYLWV